MTNNPMMTLFRRCALAASSGPPHQRGLHIVKDTDSHNLCRRDLLHLFKFSVCPAIVTVDSTTGDIQSSFQGCTWRVLKSQLGTSTWHGFRVWGLGTQHPESRAGRQCRNKARLEAKVTAAGELLPPPGSD